MLAFIKANGIKIIVDASHPYAVNVSKNAIRASQISNIKYVRYERPMISLPQYDKLHTAASYEEAAIKTADFGVNVFLTIGSRMLDKFKNEPKLKNHRLIARVLPDPVVIADCIKLGFSLNDIIGMQGPFSHAMNLAMFKDFNANVIVMKNSGQIGGSGTKLSAAIELNLPIIMIDRPILQYPNVMTNYSDILCYIKEVF